jgi:hypothetical protein
MTDVLLLGSVSFQNFELPGHIGFGGTQRLAVHVLPGGARVIDAMGRDDAEIAWRGTFSGPDAADRARLLDAMRVSGAVQSLAWDAFCYLVVISSFEANYERASWVPYRISCTVVADQAQSSATSVVSLSTMLLADLASAALDGVDTTLAVAALGVTGATSPGTPGYAAAQVALSQVQGNIGTNMTSVGAALLAAPDPATAATAAGSLAQYADANGYVGRTLANLDNAET